MLSSKYLVVQISEQVHYESETGPATIVSLFLNCLVDSVDVFKVVLLFTFVYHFNLFNGIFTKKRHPKDEKRRPKKSISGGPVKWKRVGQLI